MNLIRLNEENDKNLKAYLDKFSYELIDIKSSFEEFGLSKKSDKKSGDFFGYVDETGEIFGVFLFDNKRSMYCHFIDDTVLKKVDLLKAIRYYDPLYLFGKKDMADKIFVMIQKALRNFKYDECILMKLEELHVSEGEECTNIINATDYEFMDAIGFLIEVEKSFGRNPKIVSNMRQHLSERFKQDEYLLYLIDNKPVGQVILEKETKEFAVIGGLYVTPRTRRKGISGHLMNKILYDITIKKKVPVLIVKKNNTAAIKLYEKFGFIKILDTLSINIEF